MKSTLKNLRDRLRPIYGERETEAIIRLIFYHLKGWNLTDMLIHADDELSPFIKKEIEEIVERLEKQEPIQYIVGNAWFHGMMLDVDRNVLIPRPETDELVDLIIDRYGECRDLNVLDIGTGSGCIAIALAKNLPFANVAGIDISEKAIGVAKNNSVGQKAHVRFETCDLFKYHPTEDLDIIVSNPPYIDESEKSAMETNVKDYEPAEALFVPDDNPLVYYKGIIEIAKASLKQKGTIFLEINPRHSSELKSLLKDSGFCNSEVVKDIHGKDRFIISNR